MTMNDSFDLARFTAAQDGVYAGVMEELRRGKKTGHWIWYIFPQIAGLGRSHMSRRFGIASIDEAKAYIRHPVLGPRLIECIELLLAVEGNTARQIFGPVDALKFRSCLTLFSTVERGTDVCRRALVKYYDGIADPLTTRALGDN